MRIALPQIACVSRPVPHQVRASEAIAKSLTRMGAKVRLTHDRIPPEAIVFVWSMKWARQIWEKHPKAIICVLDHGLFHPRNTAIVTGWMGLNGWGEHAAFSDGGHRLRMTGWDQKVQPVRSSSGKVALLIGQCFNDVQIHGHFEDYSQWLKDRARELAQEGYKVRFRPHPVQARNDLGRYGQVAARCPHKLIHDSLKDADLVVGYNSNALLDAWMFGIKNIRVYNNGSMLWRYSRSIEGKDYRVVDLMQRERAAQEIAWAQWTDVEIEKEDTWALSHIPIMRRLVDGEKPRYWCGDEPVTGVR